MTEDEQAADMDARMDAMQNAGREAALAAAGAWAQGSPKQPDQYDLTAFATGMVEGAANLAGYALGRGDGNPETLEIAGLAMQAAASTEFKGATIRGLADRGSIHPDHKAMQ